MNRNDEKTLELIKNFIHKASIETLEKLAAIVDVELRERDIIKDTDNHSRCIL